MAPRTFRRRIVTSRARSSASRRRAEARRPVDPHRGGRRHASRYAQVRSGASTARSGPRAPHNGVLLAGAPAARPRSRPTVGQSMAQAASLVRPGSVRGHGEQARRSRRPAPGALRVVPAHRQAALGTAPAFLLGSDPLLDAQLAHLREVRQVFLAVRVAASVDQVRDAVAGQLHAVGTATPALRLRRAEPDVAGPTVGSERAAAEASVAVPPGIRPRHRLVLAVLGHVREAGSAVRAASSREVDLRLAPSPARTSAAAPASFARYTAGGSRAPTARGP